MDRGLAEVVGRNLFLPAGHEFALGAHLYPPVWIGLKGAPGAA